MSTRNVRPSDVLSPIAPHELRRDALRRREVGGGRAVVDEDHVDVGRVRELGAAEPTEADDRERQRRLERTQRGFDARVGEARELASGRVERREAEHVARADAQEVAALEAAQPRAPTRVVFAPVERVERFVDELARAWPRS